MDSQLSGEIEQFISAIRAHTTGYWQSAPRLDRWLWLARLAVGPYPSRALRREARDILAARRQEREDLRTEAFRLMSRNEAIKVLQEGEAKHGLGKFKDAQYVVAVSDAIRKRKVGAEPYVLAGAINPDAKTKRSIEEIQSLHMQGKWLEIPSVERARMVQVLRMTARSASPAKVKLKQIARAVLAENNIPLMPPKKYEPERKERDDKTNDRLIAAFHGMVARQMHVLRDRLSNSRLGVARVPEDRPARFAAALRLIEMGEAILVRDIVEAPKHGPVKTEANERTPRRVLIISQVENTRTAPEEMI